MTLIPFSNTSVKNQRGVSLLEVLIAIFILLVGLGAILSLSNFALSSANNSRMRLIASGLAQEGIEIVRDIRRLNTDDTGWHNWYSTLPTNPTHYYAQYDSTSLKDYVDSVLLLDKSTGLYQYNLGDQTTFKRKITLQKLSDDELKVVVEVSWQVKGNEHRLVVEDRLWNWKSNPPSTP